MRHLQVCHLVASFCSTSSKGSSLPQVQGKRDAALGGPSGRMQERLHRRPASATFVTGALSNRFKYLALSPLLWDLGLQCFYPSPPRGSSDILLVFRRKPQLLGEPGQSLARGYLSSLTALGGPLNPATPNDSQFPECAVYTLALPFSPGLAHPSPSVVTAASPFLLQLPEHLSIPLPLFPPTVL